MSRRIYPRGLALCCIGSIPPGTAADGTTLDCHSCTAQMVVTNGIWHLNRHLIDPGPPPDDEEAA